MKALVPWFPPRLVLLQVPSYQGSPHESSLLPGNGRGHSRPTRSRSDHSLHSTYTTATGGARRPLAEPVVLKSVYVENTGWASQVSRSVDCVILYPTIFEGKCMIRKQLYRLFLERERSPFFGTDYRDLMLSQCFFGSFFCILHSTIPNTDNRLLPSKSEAMPHETIYQTQVDYEFD